MYAYNKTRAGREILKHKLAEFLYTRSTKLNDFVRAHVPELISGVMLSKKSWIPDNKTTSTLRRVLCELFVRNCDGALTCVLTDMNKLNISHKKVITASSTVNLIATAAAIGDLGGLRHDTVKNKDLLWRMSPAFGYPLDAAVYAGHFGVVKAIAQQAITGQDEDVVDLHNRCG